MPCAFSGHVVRFSHRTFFKTHTHTFLLYCSEVNKLHDLWCVKVCITQALTSCKEEMLSWVTSVYCECMWELRRGNEPS